MRERRVALVSHATSYAGPAVARALAGAGHDLVVHAPRPGLVDELHALGVEVEVADEPGSFFERDGWTALTDAAFGRFGRLDAVALFPPVARLFRPVPRGPFLDATIEDLQSMYTYWDSTFHALQVVIPVLRDHGGGQVVVLTSDSGTRPEADWAMYGAIRAGQNFLIRAVALEHAHDGINLNVVGSKNAVYDGWFGSPEGSIDDHHVTPGDWSKHNVAETPLGRLGTMDELAAFTLVLLDGRNRFQTAQFFSFSGGWHAK